MTKGRLSKYWGEAQQLYYYDRYGHDKELMKTLSARRWQIQFIRAMWRFFDGVWKHRNDLIHDNDQTINTAQLARNITRLYEDPDRFVSEDDLDLFIIPLEERLRYKPMTNYFWYETAKVAAEAYGNFLTFEDHRQTSIRTYFATNN